MLDNTNMPTGTRNPIFNPDNPLGAIRYDFLATVRPELVEGFVLQRKWFDKAFSPE